jgi:hypothetical protein
MAVSLNISRCYQQPNTIHRKLLASQIDRSQLAVSWTDSNMATRGHVCGCLGSSPATKWELNSPWFGRAQSSFTNFSVATLAVTRNGRSKRNLVPRCFTCGSACSFQMLHAIAQLNIQWVSEIVPCFYGYFPLPPWL